MMKTVLALLSLACLAAGSGKWIPLHRLRGMYGYGTIDYGRDLGYMGYDDYSGLSGYQSYYSSPMIGYRSYYSPSYVSSYGRYPFGYSSTFSRAYMPPISGQGDRSSSYVRQRPAPSAG